MSVHIPTGLRKKERAPAQMQASVERPESSPIASNTPTGVPSDDPPDYFDLLGPQTRRSVEPSFTEPSEAEIPAPPTGPTYNPYQNDLNSNNPFTKLLPHSSGAQPQIANNADWWKDERPPLSQAWWEVGSGAPNQLQTNSQQVLQQAPQPTTSENEWWSDSTSNVIEPESQMSLIPGVPGGFSYTPAPVQSNGGNEKRIYFSLIPSIYFDSMNNFTENRDILNNN